MATVEEMARRRARRRLWLLWLIPSALLVVWQRSHPGQPLAGLLPPSAVGTLAAVCGALAALSLMGRWNCPVCGWLIGRRYGRMHCPHCGAELP